MAVGGEGTAESGDSRVVRLCRRGPKWRWTRAITTGGSGFEGGRGDERRSFAFGDGVQPRISLQLRLNRYWPLESNGGFKLIRDSSNREKFERKDTKTLTSNPNSVRMVCV